MRNKRFPTPESPELPIPRWEFVTLMAAIWGLQAMGVDIMLPALEIIANQYTVQNSNDQQLIVFAYVLGFGAPQLIFGPISDRFGRKILLQVSLIGYFLTSLACMFAPSFGSLLAFRIAQGICCAGTRVSAGAIIRDLTKGRPMASILSLVYTVFMIVPILAPTFGTAIMAIAGWKWIFGFLAMLPIPVFIWVQFRLPATLKESDRRPISAKKIIEAFKMVFTHRITVGYMLASGIIFGSLFAFLGSSEQVFDEVFARGDKFYLYFAGIAGLLAIMNFSNSRFVGRFGMRRISHAVVLIFIALSLINWFYMQFIGQNFWVFYILFIFTFGCFGMMGANFSSLALEYMGHIAGTANAVYGFMTLVLSGFIGFLVARSFDGTVRPLLIAYIILGIASLCVILITERGKLIEVGEGRS